MYLIAKIDGFNKIDIITKCKTRLDIVKFSETTKIKNLLVIKADDIKDFVNKST